MEIQEHKADKNTQHITLVEVIFYSGRNAAWRTLRYS
jgi:hypothetical protein